MVDSVLLLSKLLSVIFDTTCFLGETVAAELGCVLKASKIESKQSLKVKSEY